MENRYSVSPWAASASPDQFVGRALVLPGGRYTVDQQLLFWACHVLTQAGWRVVTMRWTWTESDEPRSFVEQGAQKLDREAGPELTTLVVAKSLGSYAAGWASSCGYPAVWLTPVLTDDFVADALAGYATEALLVGGSADPLWDGDRAAATGLEKLEVPGADHGLQLADNWRASISVLQETLAAIEDFSNRISARGRSHLPGDPPAG